MVLMFPELVPVVGCLSFAIMFKKWQHRFFAALLFVLDHGVDDMHGGETLDVLEDHPWAITVDTRCYHVEMGGHQYP